MKILSCFLAVLILFSGFYVFAVSYDRDNKTGKIIVINDVASRVARVKRTLCAYELQYGSYDHANSIVSTHRRHSVLYK